MHKGSNLSSINKNIVACQMLHYPNANKSENDEKTLFARILHVHLFLFFSYLVEYVDSRLGITFFSFDLMKIAAAAAVNHSTANTNMRILLDYIYY